MKSQTGKFLDKTQSIPAAAADLAFALGFTGAVQDADAAATAYQKGDYATALRLFDRFHEAGGRALDLANERLAGRMKGLGKLLNMEPVIEVVG